MASSSREMAAMSRSRSVMEKEWYCVSALDMSMGRRKKSKDGRRKNDVKKIYRTIFDHGDLKPVVNA